ncbi:MAG: inositol monophosphatase family protein [Candidatus Baltobacteraceae bacterium]
MPHALTTAVAAARRAGALLLEQLHRPLHIEEKGRRADLVTAADRQSERLIVETLLEAFPQAAILGEEGAAVPGSSDERWIVDPLDGTTNYAHGYPFFCVSIAYERAGIIEAGVVYAPLLKECFTAVRGGGAFLNGERIFVSRTVAVGDAMLCTGFKPYDYETNAAFFAHASRHAQAVRRDGAAALDFAYTAMGRFDAFWEFGLAAWDVAAGALFVREAGGAVSAIDGAPFSVDGASVLASNGVLHEPLKELFAPLLRL